MKRIFTFMACTLLFLAGVHAQQIPHGMKYQAVARNLKGEVMTNEPLSLKINLTSNGPMGRSVHYSEVHDVTTNELGLFTLVIGEGKTASGAFAKIPWSTQDIWMEVSIKEKNKGGDFSVISNSKLLAVPYAFHAATASQLVNDPLNIKAGAAGVPANVWSLKGNSKSDPAVDKFGTTDFADLVFVTNNIERLRILKSGEVDLATDLTIGQDLYVKRNVYLNTEGGATINNGPFTVDKESPTSLTGNLTVDKETVLKNTLAVDGATDLNSTLNVNNMSATNLSGTLTVDKATDLNATLNVDGAAVLKNTLEIEGATDLNTTLNVDGKARFRDEVTFDKSIAIAGAMNSSSLNITDDAAEHLATFTNTNAGDGDGILIKLGKVHPRWNGSDFVTVPNPGVQGLETQINQIRSWIYGDDDFSVDDLINLAPSQYMAGTVCNLTNYVTEKINSSLGLPYKIGPYSTPAIHIWNASTIFGGLDLGALGEIPKLEIPALNIPSVAVIPQVIAMPKIPQLNCSSLPTLEWPVLSFTDVNGSLTKENEFITFADKDGRKLGAIRAQSIQNFSIDYYDGVQLLNLASQIIGLDILNDAVGVIAGVSQMVSDYNNIGVEYSSGNGDYAEWLERLNPKETITTGDIIGVKGGKITKNLEGAEQIMAVSHRPIVLGNMPSKEKINDGNTIAFMGQIPVKVMGPVQAGDYIVGRGSIAGYGIAVHPKNMRIEDYKLAVGRSWDSNDNEGPKMVNTVVGVHNHDFLNIISAMQNKVESTDRRLKVIEDKLNLSGENLPTQKKAFK